MLPRARREIPSLEPVFAIIAAQRAPVAVGRRGVVHRFLRRQRQQPAPRDHRTRVGTRVRGAGREAGVPCAGIDAAAHAGPRQQRQGLGAAEQQPREQGRCPSTGWFSPADRLVADPMWLGPFLAEALLLVRLVFLVVARRGTTSCESPSAARIWVAMRSRNQRSWLITSTQPANSSSASSSARSVSTCEIVGRARRAAARCRPAAASSRGAVARARHPTDCRCSSAGPLP